MTTDYEVRCPDCNTLVATESGENANQARRDGVMFPCEPCARRRYDDKPSYVVLARKIGTRTTFIVSAHGTREAAEEAKDDQAWDANGKAVAYRLAVVEL